MTLTELDNTIRLYVPGAGPSVLTQSMLWSLINKGVQDVNERLKVLRKNVKFNITSGKTDYKISTDICSDFVCMDESGAYYYDGAYWQQLFPKTRKWLDDNIMNWRSYAATSKPQYYFIEPDLFVMFASYNADVTNGGLLHYIGKPVALTSGTQYPWSRTSSPLVGLDCLDDAIIAYTQWKLAQPLGQKANGVIDKATYEDRIQQADTLLRSRIDMSNSRYFRMRGPQGWAGSSVR